MTAKIRLEAVLAALAVFGASAALLALQAAEEPVTELDGVWVVQSAERAGKPMQLSSFNAPGDSRITFRGTKATLKGFSRTPTGDEVTYDATVDAKAAPKALTLILGNDVIATVYELTGDTLRLVLPRPGLERPTKVSSDTYALFSLKKSN